MNTSRNPMYLSMTKIVRTNSKNQDFIDLVKLLDADLTIRDGDEHAFYDQFNKIDTIKYVLILYDDNIPVGCGAIKEFNVISIEIKRMFVTPSNRGKGIASRILNELENWATELSYKKCILETGKKQPEAIALYKKSGYTITENYGQYANVKNSVCFEKKLK